MPHVHKRTYGICFLFEDKKDYTRSFFRKLGAIIKIILIEFVENIKLLSYNQTEKLDTCQQATAKRLLFKTVIGH